MVNISPHSSNNLEGFFQSLVDNLLLKKGDQTLLNQKIEGFKPIIFNSQDSASIQNFNLLCEKVKQLHVSDANRKIIYEGLARTILCSICPPSTQPAIDVAIHKMFQENIKTTVLVAELGFVCDVLSLIPQKDLNANALKNCLLLCHQMDSADQDKIRNTLISMNKRQRKNVIQHACPLFKDEDSGVDRAKILKALSLIVENQRKNVIEHAQPFFQDNDTGQERAEILKTIARAKIKDRKNALEHAHLLFKPHDTGMDRAYHLQAVVNIAEEQRKIIIQLSQPLFQDAFKGIDRASILQTLFEIGKDQRENIIQHAQPLFQKNDKGYDRAKILQILSKINQGQRENVIQQSQSFFQDSDRGYDRACILQALTGIGETQIESMTKQSKQLFQINENGANRAHLLQVLSKIDEKQREDIIRQAQLLFHENDKGYDRAKILEALAHIDVEQRENVINYAQFVFQCSDRGLIRAKILAMIARIEKEQRENVIKHALSIYKGVNKEMDQAEILQAIYDIDSEQRENVIEWTLSLFQPHDTGNDRLSLVRAIDRIEDNQRENVIEWARSLFQLNDTQTDRMLILYAINEIDADQRGNVITQASSFFRKTDTGTDRTAILGAFRKIDPKQINSAIQHARPLCRDKDSGEDRATILKALAKIDEKQREHVIHVAQPLFQHKDKGYERASILKIIAGINEEERESFVLCAQPLLQSSDNGSDRINILEAIAKIDKEQREPVIQYASTLFKDKDNGLDQAHILETVNKINRDQRQRVTQHAQPFFQDFDSGSDRASIIRVIAELDERQIEKIVQYSYLLFHERDKGYERAKIIKSVAKINAPLIENVIQQCIPFFKDVHDASDRGALTILYAEFLDTERTIDSLMELINLYTHFKGIFPGEHEHFLRCIKIIAPQHKLAALDSFKKEKELPVRDISSKIFQDETIKNDTCQFLLDLLNTFTHREQGLEVAEDTLAFMPKFGLSEEAPLIQKALEVVAHTNPEAFKNKKNPYRLYQDLKTLIQEPLLEFSIPRFLIGEKKLELNLDRLRTPRKFFTFADLPTGIQPDCLEKIFKGLETRLASLSVEERAAIEQDIEKNYLKSLSKLKANLLAESSLISRYLRLKGSLQDPIQRQVLYVYSIVKMLLDQDASPSTHFPFLSLQEFMLLNMSTSITACDTGQRDAIDQYYHYGNLPDKYKQVEAESTPIEKTQLAIEDCVQKVLNTIFTSDALYTSLTNQPLSDQQAHQTLYLKNRYHKQTGLDHQITFDPYSGQIENTLMSKKTEEVVPAILSHLKPEKMMHQLKLHLAASLANKSMRYGDLKLYLDNMVPEDKQQPIGWERAYLHFKSEDDEEVDYYVCIGMTEKGALEMLLASGYYQLR